MTFAAITVIALVWCCAGACSGAEAATHAQVRARGDTGRPTRHHVADDVASANRASAHDGKCPPELIAPPGWPNGSQPVDCFAQLDCAACVATQPLKSLCGWCPGKINACVHHYGVNCPPVPGPIIDNASCPEAPRASAVASQLEQSPPSSRQPNPGKAAQLTCPDGYVACSTRDSGAEGSQCAPCSDLCFPFWDPSLSQEARATDLVSRLTTAEKIALLTNSAAGVPRLGVQPWSTSECLHGYNPPSVNGTTLVATQFPCPLNLGASFNTTLVSAIGRAIGVEARALNNLWVSRGFMGPGLHCFSPNSNIARDPLWGRNMETYGEDPTLISAMVVAYVTGMQQRGALSNASDGGVLLAAAVPKHFTVYTLENTSTTDRYAFNAEVDRRDLLESYLPQWAKVTNEAHATGVMASYNAINGVPASANGDLLRGFLRGEGGWLPAPPAGFAANNGFVLSDGNSVQDVFSYHHWRPSLEETVTATLLNGTDMDLGDVYQQALPAAVRDGLVSTQLLDVAVTRVVLTRFRVGLFDLASVNPYLSIPPSAAASEEHANIAFEAAVQGIVLLKNTAAAGDSSATSPILPLDVQALAGSGHGIAVVGPNADDPSIMLGNYAGTPPYIRTPLDGVRRYLNASGLAGKVPVRYARGCVGVWCEDQRDFPAALAAARASSVVVACVGLSPAFGSAAGGVEAEMHDRVEQRMPGQQEALLRALAATGTPVVVVLLNGGAVTVSGWITGAAAVLEAHYPGQEGGDALAAILFGAASPSARMVYSVYSSEAAVPPHTSMSFTDPPRTYRYVTADDASFSLRFGDGIGFTTFEYSDLQVVGGDTVKPCETVAVRATVSNTGSTAAAEVAQLYVSGANVSLPGVVTPVRALADFVRTGALAPGESATLEFEIAPAAMAIVAGAAGQEQQVIQAPRTFVLSVGGSQPRPAYAEWNGHGSARGFAGTTVLTHTLFLAGSTTPLRDCGAG